MCKLMAESNYEKSDHEGSEYDEKAESSEKDTVALIKEIRGGNNCQKIIKR